MAPIDNGEEKIERISSEVGRAGGQAIVRVAIRLAAGASKAVIAQSLRGGASAARNAAKWAAAAVTQPGGKVSMKELSELPSKTGREVVSLDDKDVMQALETNLKKRGVHYAIEREKIDGKIQHILHVRGDDSHVVADSLERAAESVDAQRERKQERSVERDTPKQERSDDAETPKQKEPSSKTQDQPKQKPKQPAAEGKDRQRPAKPEPTGTPKRSKAETAQMQKEIRQKVKAQTAKIKAEAPKKSPKLDAPTPGLKR